MTLEKRRSLRRKASFNRKSFDPMNISMPKPKFDLEDVLVSQLQLSDVFNNCVVADGTPWHTDGTTDSDHLSVVMKSHFTFHRCFNDTKLNPVWQAFGALDVKSQGKLPISKLCKEFSSVFTMLGLAADMEKILEQFAGSPLITFSQFNRYILANVDCDRVNTDRLSVACWHCAKSRYLISPYVDTLHSVVSDNVAESMFWLFCVFNNLMEPGKYPAVVDYEEAEMLMRKIMASLGIRWTNLDNENLSSSSSSTDDNMSSITEDQNLIQSQIQVSFHQLLSIISDMVGVDCMRSSSFHRSMQWLCLTEYKSVMKAGWLQIRKPGTETWKKRWAVLQGADFVCYATSNCTTVKEQLHLYPSMHIETLPNQSQKRNRFRIVEKEGDLNIKFEHELCAPDSNSAHSWVNLINIAIKLQSTGMTAKTAEVCERRVERHRRRNSVRDVQRKKKDLRRIYSRLEEIRQNRTEIEAAIAERARKRQEQMEVLSRMDDVYERLEELHYEDRMNQRTIRYNSLRRANSVRRDGVSSSSDSTEESVFVDNSSPSTISPKSPRKLREERLHLERKLEELRLSSCLSSHGTPRHVTSSPPLTSYDYRSGSVENMSTTSTDWSLTTPPELSSFMSSNTCC